MKKNNQELIIRDLQGTIIWRATVLADELAADFFYCVLEQEDWAQNEILEVLEQERSLNTYLSHPTWEQNTNSTPREDNTIINIFINAAHKYNLTLE